MPDSKSGLWFSHRRIAAGAHSRPREALRSTRHNSHSEAAINMLGPDSDMVAEIMTSLGPKHVKYGVKADMFAILGQCLIDTLSECLNDESPGSFRSDARDAWEEVYFNLSSDILKAYSKDNRRKSAT